MASPLSEKRTISQSESIEDENICEKNEKSYTSILSDTKLIDEEKNILYLNICVQKCSEIKKKLIFEVKKLKLQTIKKNPKILFDLVLENQNLTKKLPKETSKGHYKNLPKILGNAIISFTIKAENSKLIQQYIDQKNSTLAATCESQTKKSLRDFFKWMKQENVKKEFVTRKTFREIWGHKLHESTAKNFRHRFCSCVLKKISKYFIKNEFTRFIFRKVKNGSMDRENAFCYLDKISVFVRGLSYHQQLQRIKEFVI